MNKRNINTADILSKLQLGQKRVSGIDVASQFHHLFWYGDPVMTSSLQTDSLLWCPGSAT